MGSDLKNKTYEIPESFKRNHQFMPITGNPISLRDQFAMNAIPMTWRLVEAGCLDPDVNDMARYAYQMADAMLAARDK